MYIYLIPDTYIELTIEIVVTRYCETVSYIVLLIPKEKKFQATNFNKSIV